jgi:Chaperone of endosialidase
MAFRRRLARFGPAGIEYLDMDLIAARNWYGPGFNQTSDERTKANVRQVQGALDKLGRIRGVAFEWAETESPAALGDVPGKPSIGVVAQEVEEVFPEVVSIYDDDQEYKAVNYDGLTSVLIEAVKELKAEIETLRSRIEALEGA